MFLPETLHNFYPAALSYIPEDSNLRDRKMNINENRKEFWYVQ
jgi:hypothetical protein